MADEGDCDGHHSWKREVASQGVVKDEISEERKMGTGKLSIEKGRVGFEETVVGLGMTCNEEW